MNNFFQIIQAGKNLTRKQAAEFMNVIMSGQADEDEVSTCLVSMAKRGESQEEITGMLQSMRAHMTKIDLGSPLLDTCGTGGDGQNTFNISTAVAIACAGMGVPVAKHGNRAASSKCGSADVLEALGIPIELSNQKAKKYFKKNNFVFLFARTYHPAIRFVVPIRQKIKMRTIFNFLGPLSNPASATHQIIGVSDSSKAELIGTSLITLGSQHVIVVYSDDGLDEASIAKPTTVIEFTPQEQRTFQIKPIEKFSLQDIKGGTPEKNATLMKKLATGQANPGLNTAVAMNTGLALLAANQVDDYEQGLQQAQKYLQSGKMAQFIEQLCQF